MFMLFDDTNEGSKLYFSEKILTIIVPNNSHALNI